MDVAISTLRAELSSWIDRVRDGDEIIITERGVPVARLSRVDTAPLLDRLVQSGVISKARTTARPTARKATRARASGSVSDLVTEQRR